MYKNSLLKKFKKTDLHQEYFPYIQIENALDEKFYETLSAEFPKLESFTNECPVICSNTSSFPEVGGDAVSYFDPYKTDSIFESIYKTFYSDSFRKELILKGQSRNKLFTWKKTALDHLNLYKC